MQVTNINQNNSPNFKGIWNNRALLKGLEKVSEHGTTFAAGTSLVMSLGVRPFVILATPDVEKENRQYAAANSIGSGLMKFAIVEAVAYPVESAVKKIDKNPSKFLSSSTIENLKEGSSELAKSRSYKLGTQIMKLGTGFLTAIPKSMLTIALIPIIMDKIFNKKPKQGNLQNTENTSKTQTSTSYKIPFTGGFTEKISKGIGKIFDNKNFQKHIKNNAPNDRDIAKHMTAATDILLTSSFAWQTSKSEKIKENRKKALIYNNAISTAITIVGGYSIDRIIKKGTEKFIDKFSKINAADPKLHKYIEGINIVRPTLIFAAIYYGILPMFSTYIAEKVDKYIESKKA